MTSPVLDLAFAALSDPTRREIVQRLAKGAARVTDLVQPFATSVNAVSKHVKGLEPAGPGRRTRAGRGRTTGATCAWSGRGWRRSRGCRKRRTDSSPG